MRLQNDDCQVGYLNLVEVVTDFVAQKPQTPPATIWNLRCADLCMPSLALSC